VISEISCNCLNNGILDNNKLSCQHDYRTNVMCEGEAIWNACLGTTALSVNVDLPSNEVFVPAVSHKMLMLKFLVVM